MPDMLSRTTRHRVGFSRSGRTGWRDELVRLDTAVYSAIAKTRTPFLDRALRRRLARG